MPRLIAEQAMVAGLLRLGGFEPSFPFALGHGALVVSSATKDWQRFLAIVHAFPQMFLNLPGASAAGSAAFKSRPRKITRQIVRRGKLHGFRVVNHARPIAELISVPLTDDHLDL